MCVQGKPSDAGPDPPNYLSQQVSFHPPVLFDATPLGKNFGDVDKDAESSYSIVSVSMYTLSVQNDVARNERFDNSRTTE